MPPQTLRVRMASVFPSGGAVTESRSVPTDQTRPTLHAVSSDALFPVLLRRCVWRNGCMGMDEQQKKNKWAFRTPPTHSHAHATHHTHPGIQRNIASSSVANEVRGSCGLENQISQPAAHRVFSPRLRSRAVSLNCTVGTLPCHI